MSPDKPTRRRAITIFAAATAGAMVGGPIRFAAADYEWRGTAMGADATILFNGVEAEAAHTATAAAITEIERLEGALSLFRRDSELHRLNRETLLRSPSGDMRRALTLALDIAAASAGLFDPSVQALWEAHADWFSAAPDSGLPPDSVIAKAGAAVDWRRIVIDHDLIRLGAGQRITLNGLGQGYVTDRVADLLYASGLRHILVDLGEQRAIAPRRSGEPWLVARRNAAPVALRQGALATSEGAGCMFGAFGAAHHLFDPRTGRCPSHWKRLTVHHRSAAIADALSTAFYAASADEIQALHRRFAGIVVWALDRDEREWRWISPPVDGLSM